VLIAGRSDGFGMMFCNFLYHALVARRLNKDLVLVWPSRLPHLRRANECSLDVLFKDYDINFVTVTPEVVKSVEWQNVGTHVFLQLIQALRSEFRRLSEHDDIQQKVLQMPVYDYSIHARFGDAEQKPLQHGGGQGRYFPLSGYQSLITKILNNEPTAKIFMASNAPKALCLKQQFPHSVTTESDLLARYESVDPESLVAAWLVIRQLSKAAHIISPAHSSFSLLARVTSSSLLHHSTPAEFLQVTELIDDLHRDYSAHAKSLFLSPRLTASYALWNRLLLGRWKKIPLRVRLEVCLKILFS